MIGSSPGARLHLVLTSFVAALGLGTVGCEETPAPPAQGGFDVALSDTGSECPLSSHANEVGDFSGDSPSLVTDGAENTTVACTIRAASGGFQVQASIRGDAYLSLDIESISNKQSEETPAKGQLAYTATETGGDTFASPTETPCSFWVDSEAGQYIEAGKAFLSFRCDDVRNVQESCSMVGTFALANCAAEEQPVEE